MADHYRTGVNARSHGDLAALGETTIDPLDSLDDLEAGAHRPFGIVAMRARPAEIRDDSIALVLRDIAIVTAHDARNGLMIGLDDMMIFFGVEAGGELGRADEIGEKHGQVAPLSGNRRFRGGAVFAREGRCGRRSRAAITTESFGRRDRRAARRAQEFETLTAFDAEALLRKIGFAAMLTDDRRHWMSLCRARTE